ncbi:hypothetical protein UT300003_32450 [Clostridium sardiniense]
MSIKSLEELDKAIEILEAITGEFCKMREVVVDDNISEKEAEEKLAQFIGKVIILQAKLDGLEV